MTASDRQRGSFQPAGKQSTQAAGLTMVQAYARFMIAFIFVVGILCVIRPLTDAPGTGLFFWPQPARSFGLFLINWFHFVLHMVLCVWAALAIRRTSLSRVFAQWVCGICAVLVLIGLFTPDGVWLIPAHWPQDARNGQIALISNASWYGYIPANLGDDVINGLVALSGLVFGCLAFGLRPWGYWRRRAIA